jgi:sulfur-oxidizing protein SoxZ
MAEAMRIRATLVKDSDVADVRILMRHPMDTGQRKDAKGEIVPTHFIQNVLVTLNGKIVLDAQWSQAVSRDPFLGLRVKGAKAGDKVAVTWTDNKGDKRTDEATVATAS